jgi:hypothetical protein
MSCCRCDPEKQSWSFCHVFFAQAKMQDEMTDQESVSVLLPSGMGIDDKSDQVSIRAFGGCLGAERL